MFTRHSLTRMLLVVMAVAIIQISVLAQGRLTNVSSQGMGLRWEPTVSFSSATLKVVGPDGVLVTETFDSGLTPTLTLFTKKGARFPDGSYTYEIAFAPVMSRSVFRTLANARERGDEEAVAQDLRNRGLLPARPLIESGSFAIKMGQVYVNGLTEPTIRVSRTANAANKDIIPNDVVTADDSIIQGSQCVGIDCVNNENFGFDTQRLKENNTRLQFDDTSSTAGFATTNWQIRANDSGSGGASYLGIVDQGDTGFSEEGTIVLRVNAGAPSDSLRIGTNGKVGFRTATPALDLHMNTSDTPAVRFEQNNTGGFTAQTWDIGANEANFFVRDTTGGSRLSFRIRPGAPTSSLDIAATGNVGVGQAAPRKKLHVGQGTDVPVTTVDGIYVTNDGATALAIRDSTNNIEFQAAIATSVVSGALLGSVTNHPLILRTNAAERIRIEAAGNVGIGTAAPTDLLSVNGTASKPGGGSWSVFSDRRLKNVKGTFNTGLASVLKLQPLRFEYKQNNALGIKPEGQYVGFEAQSVERVIPEAVTMTTSGYLMVNNDPIMWTMLNAIKEQQAQIEELRKEINRLKAAKRKRR